MTLDYRLDNRVFAFIHENGPVTLAQIEEHFGDVCWLDSELELAMWALFVDKRIEADGNTKYRVTTDHGRLQSE